MAALKDIDIKSTKRTGSRRASPASADEARDAIAPALRPTVRPTTAQPVHRFHVGEKLRLAGGGRAIARGEGSCKVVSLLPYEGRGILLYRVRSETESYERVVAEIDLSRD